MNNIIFHNLSRSPQENTNERTIKAISMSDQTRIQRLLNLSYKQRQLFRQEIQKLTRTQIELLFTTFLFKNKRNLNLRKWLDMYQINENSLRFLKTDRLKKFLQLDSFIKIKSSPSARAEHLALVYGNIAQQNYSCNGGSRLILSKVEYPIANVLNSTAFDGGFSYGQKYDNSIKSYSKYIDIDCNSSSTTIEFTIDVSRTRPGVVSCVYMVPMGLYWDKNIYTSYTDYSRGTDSNLSFDNITEDLWYVGLNNQAKLDLIQNLASEYGFGYNDAQGIGMGSSIEIDNLELTITGVQTTLHGVIVDNDNYIKNHNDEYILLDGDRVLLKDVTSSHSCFELLCYDKPGKFVNIHGQQSTNDTITKTKLSKKISTSSEEIIITTTDLTTYGPGPSFWIH
jgi:hypothetical protein